MDAPALAVSREGTHYAIAWMDKREKRERIWYRLFGAGAKDVDGALSSSEERQTHPQIALDGSSRIWAVWEEGEANRTRVVCRRPGSADGFRLGTDDEGASSFPVIALVPDGSAVVAYEVKNNIVVRRVAAR